VARSRVSASPSRICRVGGSAPQRPPHIAPHWQDRLEGLLTRACREERAGAHPEALHGTCRKGGGHVPPGDRAAQQRQRRDALWRRRGDFACHHGCKVTSQTRGEPVLVSLSSAVSTGPTCIHVMGSVRHGSHSTLLSWLREGSVCCSQSEGSGVHTGGRSGSWQHAGTRTSERHACKMAFLPSQVPHEPQHILWRKNAFCGVTVCH
jgi:hypothetical protein